MIYSDDDLLVTEGNGMRETALQLASELRCLQACDIGGLTWSIPASPSRPKMPACALWGEVIMTGSEITGT